MMSAQYQLPPDDLTEEELSSHVAELAERAKEAPFPPTTEPSDV